MTTISIVTGGSRGLGRNTAISIARHGGDVISTYRSGAANAASTVAEIEALGRKAVALQLDTGIVASFPGFVDAVRSTLARRLGSRELRPPRQQCRPRRNGQLHGDHRGSVRRPVRRPCEGRLFPHPGAAAADGGWRTDRQLLQRSHPRQLSRLFRLFRCQGRRGDPDALHGEGTGEPRHHGQHHRAGAIETDFLGGAVRDTPAYNEAFASIIALGRVGLPDDIGPAVASLLGPDNRWVTAQRIEVSGGQNI